MDNITFKKEFEDRILKMNASEKMYTHREAIHLIVDALSNKECVEMIEFIQAKNTVFFRLDPDESTDKWFLEQPYQTQRNIFNQAITLAHQSVLQDFTTNIIDETYR